MLSLETCLGLQIDFPGLGLENSGFGSGLVSSENYSWGLFAKTHAISAASKDSNHIAATVS